MRVWKNPWAAGLLVFAGLCFGLRAPALSADDGVGPPLKPAIVFYFDTPSSAQAWPAIMGAVRREVAGSEYSLPADIDLLPATDLRPGSEFGKVIEVHLRGRCDVAEQAYRPVARGPLGWVLRVGGEIQPFVYVDCERLAQFLDPKMLGMSDSQRSDAMATAIARITVHEWLHITLQSAGHMSHGIRRAELSANDLVTTGSPGS